MPGKKASRMKRRAARPRATKAPADKALARQVKSLRENVEELTRTVVALYHLERTPAETGMATLEATAPDAPPVRLKFEKRSGPDKVRLTLLDTHEVVLAFDDDKGESEPRQVGARFDVLMEVKGNPGEVAVIGVSRALPTTLEMSARPDGPGNVGTKPMRVVG